MVAPGIPPDSYDLSTDGTESVTLTVAGVRKDPRTSASARPRMLRDSPRRDPLRRSASPFALRIPGRRRGGRDRGSRNVTGSRRWSRAQAATQAGLELLRSKRDCDRDAAADRYVPRRLLLDARADALKPAPLTRLPRLRLKHRRTISRIRSAWRPPQPRRRGMADGWILALDDARLAPPLSRNTSVPAARRRAGWAARSRR